MAIRLEKYDLLYAHSFSAYVNMGPDSALLEFFISEESVPGSEMFTVEVDSPQCLERELREVNDVKVGRHQFVVREIDEDRIMRFIRRQVVSSNASDWNSIRLQFGEFAKSEFSPSFLPLSLEKALNACQGRVKDWDMRAVETQHYFPSTSYESLGLGIRLEISLEPERGGETQKCELTLCDPAWLAHKLQDAEIIIANNYLLMYDISLIAVKEWLQKQITTWNLRIRQP